LPGGDNNTLHSGGGMLNSKLFATLALMLDELFDACVSRASKYGRAEAGF